MQLCGSLSILWHCLSLELEWKLTFSSPVATAEFPNLLAFWVHYFHSIIGWTYWLISTDKNTGEVMACYLKISYKRTVASVSSVLAWRIPGTGEPGGLPSMGSHRVRYEWSDLAAAYIWAISNPERWCRESAALNMPANLENSTVATGLEKVSFHSNPKERQC